MHNFGDCRIYLGTSNNSISAKQFREQWLKQEIKSGQPYRIEFKRKLKYQLWAVGENLHRMLAPAVKGFSKKKLVHTEWFENGKRHRLIGHAYIYKEAAAWFVEGRIVPSLDGYSHHNGVPNPNFVPEYVEDYPNKADDFLILAKANNWADDQTIAAIKATAHLL